MTVTPADVVALPAASLATAVKVCAPGGAAAAFQLIENGAVRSSAPSGAPSSLNCTADTPTLSEAAALTAIVPDTTPAGGAVIATVGAVVSLVIASMLAP